MPRLAKNKPAWEVGLQGAVKEGRRGWSVVNFRGKTRLRLQFPKHGSWPADAQAFLPYPWEPGSVNPVIQLVNLIYPRVMSGEVTLKAALGDALSTSSKKADQVVTPWPGIVSAFKDHKLILGNRIAPKTFEASYERYLNIALVHLQGRKAAQTGKELIEKVLTHQRATRSKAKNTGKRSSLGSRCRKAGSSAAWQ